MTLPRHPGENEDTAPDPVSARRVRPLLVVIVLVVIVIVVLHLTGVVGG